MDNDNLPFAINNFYRKVLLEVGNYALPYDRLGQAVELPQNQTDTVKMRRYERLDKATTPLTPGVTPTGSTATITDVTATVRQYGDFITFTDTVDELNPDAVLVNLTAVLRRQWKETINSIARDYVTATTNVQYADSSDARSNTARTDIGASDKISLTEIQVAVRTLQLAGADKLTEYVEPMDGYATTPLRPCYVGIVDPYTAKDLKNTPGFVTPDKYAANTQLLEDEIGSLDEVRFVLDTEGKTYSSNVTVHATVIFGMDAYGVVRVGNTSTEIIYKSKESGGAENALNQRGSLGWKQYYACKVLNDDFIVKIEHAVSA